ncbi:hypothetical protein Leryth_006062 [Lithospermum erythrorhizon]|nr:hypothetical protein Leryth_006062 [Lithospermum erythrorhizon]
MVYSYKYSFSGFAAELTMSQAKNITNIPGVIKVMRDKHYSVPLNTRSWDYMGLSVDSPNNILYKSNMGDGIIIGIIDSGIYPSKAFDDKEHGPIPSKWKGICKSEGKFNATEICNKKVIGARWFNEGFIKQHKNPTFIDEPSPLDDEAGHGNHVASTAAGSFVDNVTYYDLNLGTFRGGAPRAKLAIYKVCWTAEKKIEGGAAETVEGCPDSDVLSAFDQAIHDGVDIISVSLGVPIPTLPEIDEANGFDIGSFHAASHGIPVVSAAGNDGPNAMTVTNVAPWDITVAASTIDRAFSILMTLGNNQTIVGEGVFAGKEIDFTIYDVMPTLYKGTELVDDMIPDDGTLEGKVVVVFVETAALGPDLVNRTAAVGGVALIMATPPNDDLSSPYSDRTSDKNVQVPLIQICYADGNLLYDHYVQNPDSATMKVSTTRIHLGKPIQIKVAKFSSRGPNARVPAILKPDISAPGANILGATSGGEKDEFTLMSGTSMAAPQVAGVIALLKKSHPDWSPAALKSAITTTAWNYDSHGFPVYAEGSSLQLANPFDNGGGVMNPNAANEPGLVYDMETTDYVHYLCALGYDKEGIYSITRTTEADADNRFSVSNICPYRRLSIFNVNVPSITIPDLEKPITLLRTVTNVGPVNSTYKAIIKAPFGTNISVKPRYLKFNSTTTKLSFIVKISATQESIFFNFGSLTWTDSKHFVRIPISVKTVLSQ